LSGTVINDLLFNWALQMLVIVCDHLVAILPMFAKCYCLFFLYMLIISYCV